MLYPAKSMSNFQWYSIYALRREYIVNVYTAKSYFLYVDSVLKFVSTFLNFPVRNP